MSAFASDSSIGSGDRAAVHFAWVVMRVSWTFVRHTCYRMNEFGIGMAGLVTECYSQASRV